MIKIVKQRIEFLKAGPETINLILTLMDSPAIRNVRHAEHYVIGTVLPSIPGMDAPSIEKGRCDDYF